jgi:single-strand DNA-binding protein
MNLNKVFILGNLTRDPERRNLPSGQPVVSFGLATNRFFKSQEGEKKQETEFHNITLFGRLADIASQYLQKGSLAFIEGRLRTRNWQDSQGIKHFRTEIIAENLQLGPRFDAQQKTQEKPPIEKISDNEIPVIEEEPEKDIKKQNEDNEKQNEDNEKENEDNEKEIDVKDIPF